MADWSVGGKTTDGGKSVVVIGDGANLDAFSRVRVSNPDTIFDSNFIYNIAPLIYGTSTANGGTVTHSAANASASLALDGTAGGSAILQSKQYHRYIPGKSQLIILTGVMGAATASVTKRWGYFDANDGIFFEQDSSGGLHMVRRTSTSGSPARNAVAQASWNLDTLDGSGDQGNPSGITLDVSKCQIFVIDLQWLGMGRVRVGFDIGGQIVYVHEFLNANVLTTVYMKRASLPVRFEISGDAAASMLATCTSVSSEGGQDRFLGYEFAYDRASVTAASGAQTYAFSIRPKSTFNSITNRMLIVPLEWQCLVTGNSSVLVEVYYGTTVGGSPSWADMNATYSGLQVDTAGTPSGGLKAHSFSVAATAANKSTAGSFFSARYPLTLDIAGTGYNHYTVYVTGIGGDSACRPGLRWEEIR